MLLILCTVYILFSCALWRWHTIRVLYDVNLTLTLTVILFRTLVFYVASEIVLVWKKRENIAHAKRMPKAGHF